MEIEVRRGDVTVSDTEAIVAAANAALAGGGGVDAAVHRAAGPELPAALRPLSPCPPGQAVVTPSFDLPAPIRWVVHAVGPRHGIDSPGPELLASAYLAALARCDEVGARSVAFPSLSTGAYRYPLEEACGISVRTLLGAVTSVQRCELVAFDGRTERAWRRALADARR